jgi:hypothetical protein
MPSRRCVAAGAQAKPVAGCLTQRDGMPLHSAKALAKVDLGYAVTVPKNPGDTFVLAVRSGSRRGRRALVAQREVDTRIPRGTLVPGRAWTGVAELLRHLRAEAALVVAGRAEKGASKTRELEAWRDAQAPRARARVRVAIAPRP